MRRKGRALPHWCCTEVRIFLLLWVGALENWRNKETKMKTLVREECRLKGNSSVSSQKNIGKLCRHIQDFSLWAGNNSTLNTQYCEKYWYATQLVSVLLRNRSTLVSFCSLLIAGIILGKADTPSFISNLLSLQEARLNELNSTTCLMFERK